LTLCQAQTAIVFSTVWLLLVVVALLVSILRRKTGVGKDSVGKKVPEYDITATGRLDVLLAEYQACLMTRDHYDSTRWLIGTIFIALGFSLFGVSFLKPITSNVWSVGLVGTLSIVLWLFFLYYDQHVEPWVRTSIQRTHCIERLLRAKNFDIKHQLSIAYDEPDLTVPKKQISAFWAVVIMTILLVTMWILRII